MVVTHCCALAVTTSYLLGSLSFHCQTPGLFSVFCSAFGNGYYSSLALTHCLSHCLYLSSKPFRFRVHGLFPWLFPIVIIPKETITMIPVMMFQLKVDLLEKIIKISAHLPQISIGSISWTG